MLKKNKIIFLFELEVWALQAGRCIFFARASFILCSVALPSEGTLVYGVSNKIPLQDNPSLFLLP